MSVHPAPLYLARHAETMFNRHRRMQGNEAHTPLTRAGFQQADLMGEALARHLAQSGEPLPTIWASPAGRTLQTAAIIAEHLGCHYFDVRPDARLRELEVGHWVGRDYATIIAEEGEIVDAAHGLFRMPIKGGEHYSDTARRLRAWMDEAGSAPAIVITHGITARVLRGMLVGGLAFDGVPIAADVPQGSILRIADGSEALLHRGSGHAGVKSA